MEISEVILKIFSASVIGYVSYYSLRWWFAFRSKSLIKELLTWSGYWLVSFVFIGSAMLSYELSFYNQLLFFFFLFSLIPDFNTAFKGKSHFL